MTPQEKLNTLCKDLGITEGEAKARFFALYWGQKVMYTDNGSGVGLYTVNMDGLYFVDKDRFYKSLSTSYLLLTPIERISEEDAEVVAKIYAIGSGEEYLSFSIGKIRERPESFLIFTKVSDYIRAKGYLVRFHNLSSSDLIELGWAKIKEE